jgi:predicted nucleic acid-binding Zn ribbon protein
MMARAAARDGGWGDPLQPVGPFVEHVLARYGLDRRLEEYRAVEAWADVVGPATAAAARAVAVRDGTLFVDVGSSVWMQELAILRDGIMTRLNERLGAPLVRKIVLSIERPPLADGTDPDSDARRPGSQEVEEPHDE